VFFFHLLDGKYLGAVSPIIAGEPSKTASTIRGDLNSPRPFRREDWHNGQERATCSITKKTNKGFKTKRKNGEDPP